MKRYFVALFVVIIILILFAGGNVMYNIRDRNSGYSLDFKLPAGTAAEASESFQVGLAKVPITPKIEDTWVDADSNARYEPKKGDTFVDKNGNGKFDAFWLAGFQNGRPAAGVHDDIWARAIVLDDGRLSVAIVVLDAIGFFHDDVVTIRKMVKEKKLPVDHVIVTSIHNHEVPDLMGLWGPKFYKTGVNDKYLKFVQRQAVKAIESATQSLRPAKMMLARIDSTASDLVTDTRPPRVLDDAINMMQFRDAEADTMLGLFMNWGDHPETLDSDNLYVTADFAHYWLDGIEKGIIYNDEVKRQGVGGIAIWANGAVGGLMTTLHCNVYDPWLKKSFKKGSFDKARAQGYRLADLVLDKVEKGQWETVQNPAMKLAAHTFYFNVSNKYFKLAGALGLFHRGFHKMKQLRSEVDLLSIGDAWILTVPGEINPEIVNGGIEVPEGADFPGDPVEVPPLRQLMKGKYNFVIGLANDEVGYMMPKTHWDTKAPYTYGSKKGFYGEINSLGPETGPKIYTEAKTMIEAF